ncbi:MAG: Serine phosphatase RsbU, regulator of sigma subunit [Mycobacterium sp.]|nr:Serine phosphatase RsbU, regulator of sigma subunit [Mycobacterium sp.]
MAHSLSTRESSRERAPRPELRLNLLGTIGATSLAVLVYVAAQLSDLNLPEAFSGVLFAIAPVCAIPATVLLAVRARAEQDVALRAVTAGLVIGCIGMILQLIAFRTISPGGGVFATSAAGTTLLFFLWHLSLPMSALASMLGRPRTVRRRVGLAIGIVVAFLCATVVPSSWALVHADGSYSLGLVIAMLALIVFTGIVIFVWVRQTGLRPTATRGWITIAMVLSVYDVALNALGHKRFSDIWWASLTIRGATYAVLLGGLIVSTATQLQRLEKYSSVELARAEGEVSNWAEVTERLLAATSALSAAVTAEDVAILLTAAGAGAIEFDDAVIYLVDSDSPGRLRMIGGLNEEDLGFWVESLHGTPYTDVLLDRQPVFLENAAEIASAFPGGTGQPAHREVRALAALPLIAGDIPIGALVVAGSRPHQFRGLERELLAALVRVGAQALQRALLYEQQSSLATTLQEALLPQSLPGRDDVDLVGRYLPATAGVDVGGDWYDVLELEDAGLLLVVGDVMGKGVPAATLMGQMRSAVRTLAAVDPDPAAILSGLDQLAISFALDDIVTLVIVALHAGTGTAIVANAGHLPPLVFSPDLDGRPATAATNTSPPIGVPVTGPRASTQIHLPPGSALMLLTDGLVEERHSDLDERMADLTERASALLADRDADLEEVADALVQPRVHRDDDVTVLLARMRLEPPAGGPGAGGSGHAASLGAVQLLHARLQNDAGAAAAARKMVREAVTRAVSDVTPELLEAMLLVTSELVTNSLRHGEPPVLLTLDRRRARLRLTVSDQGSKTPRPRLAGPDATGGRGLFLVSALATAWKIEPHIGERGGDRPGTSVWAEFQV